MSETPKGGPKREREPSKEAEKPRYEMFAARTRSLEHEQDNTPCQDYGFIDPEHGSAGVFDGLGGTDFGERAADVSARWCEQEMAKISSTDPDTVRDNLRNILLAAHREVWKIGEETQKSLATTAAVVKLFRHQGQDQAAFAWVGDSRIQLVRDGQTHILSLDDAVWLHYVKPEQRVLEQYHQALVTSDAELEELFKQGVVAIDNILRNNRITQSLGQRQRDQHGKQIVPFTLATIAPHTGVFPLNPSDRLLLTTDGIHGPVPLDKLADIVSGNPAEAPQKLIDEARRIYAQKLPRSKDDDCLSIVISPKK